MNFYIFLKFLENKDFAWGARKSSNTNFFKFIVFEECFGSQQFPSHTIGHILDDFVVPVFTHVGEAGSENNVSSLFAWK